MCLLTSLFITIKVLFYLQYCMATKVYYCLVLLIIYIHLHLYPSLNVVNVVNVINKFQTPVRECTLKYLGDSVTGMKFRIRQRQYGSGVVVVNGDFGWQCQQMHR